MSMLSYSPSLRHPPDRIDTLQLGSWNPSIDANDFAPSLPIVSMPSYPLQKPNLRRASLPHHLPSQICVVKLLDFQSIRHCARVVNG